MNKITAKDLLDNYDKAMLIDMDRKNIFIIRKTGLQFIDKKRYQETIDALGITEFED